MHRHGLLLVGGHNFRLMRSVLNNALATCERYYYQGVSVLLWRKKERVEAATFETKGEA